MVAFGSKLFSMGDDTLTWSILIYSQWTVCKTTKGSKGYKTQINLESLKISVKLSIPH